MGDKQVFIRQGKQLFTIPKEQFQGNFDALPVDNPRSEGLQWLMGGDAPIQRIDWSQFSAIPRANGEETITQTVSAVNPHGVDVVSNLDGQITKSPSIQENLARAGGTPEQIASLSASATQNAGGAYTPEQLKTAGVIPPTSVIPPNRDDILGSASQTLSDIQKRISTEGITDASGKVLLAPTPPKPPAPIGSVATSPSGTVNPPVLPQPQAEGINDTFITSMLADLDAKRKAVEASYSKQLADLKTQSEASQKKIDDLTIKQEGAIDKAQELSQPFRESLEELKRKELYITQNFEDNQKLTNELSTLLTEGNDLIRQQKEKTGLEAIRNPRINQTISDVNARAGVIQAVMNARSGQIAEAYRMIDRTVSAITADKKTNSTIIPLCMIFTKTKKTTKGKNLPSYLPIKINFWKLK